MEQTVSGLSGQQRARGSLRSALVVGGGIAGLCAARDLAAAGLRGADVELDLQFVNLR